MLTQFSRSCSKIYPLISVYIRTILSEVDEVLPLLAVRGAVRLGRIWVAPSLISMKTGALVHHRPRPARIVLDPGNNLRDFLHIFRQGINVSPRYMSVVCSVCVLDNLNYPEPGSGFGVGDMSVSCLCVDKLLFGSGAILEKLPHTLSEDSSEHKAHFRGIISRSAEYGDDEEEAEASSKGGKRMLAIHNIHSPQARRGIDISISTSLNRMEDYCLLASAKDLAYQIKFGSLAEEGCFWGQLFVGAS
ncbi:hypothetical protein An18g02920 [Aspergillus niger]|uniref:Uncharacterized protein n=2 Tax=Aspergillus niger TaxID=5061 RepID=A2RAF0_ASPNC|nr:hypothetical protein An18g02920 [Aspergillus niger]CAK48676.1 hypothetical protein An18g02920 [Aspergillus niger]